MLKKLQENIEWAWMKIKQSKSRSISVVKGKLSEQHFYIREEPIPTVSEKPVKSLDAGMMPTSETGIKWTRLGRTQSAALRASTSPCSLAR